MKRERLKSWLLSALVLLSIILTQQLWFSFPIDRVLPSLRVEKENKIDKSVLSKLISPQRITINFEGNRRTVLINSKTNTSIFENMWHGSWPFLRGAFLLPAAEYKVVSQEEWQAVRNRRSIEVNFFSPISISVLGQFVGLDKNPEIINSINNVDTILITASDNPTVMLIDTTTRKIVSSRLPETKNGLGQYMNLVENNKYIKYWPYKDIVNVKDENIRDMGLLNILSPINDKERIEGTYTANIIEYNQQSEFLSAAQSFFKDNSNIRNITETSGANIFIDGNKGVRIAPNGRIEYLSYNVESRMDYEASVDKYTAISIATQFLIENNLWEDRLIVSKATPYKDGKNQGYRICFDYTIDGKLLVGDEDETNSTMEVEILGNYVKSYNGQKMNFVEVNNTGYYAFNPVFDILAKNVNLLISGIDNKEVNNADTMMASISDISLVYYKSSQYVEAIGGYSLTPSWSLEFFGDKYLFNAITGEFMTKITRENN